MPADARSAFEPRKTPVQARSAVTVEAISEAAIQVLLSHGADRTEGSGGDVSDCFGYGVTA
jgi:hypothetical protein